MQKISLLVLALFIQFTASAQTPEARGWWIRVTDTTANTYGYRDETGKMVIPLGKYPVCYTDSFENYAIVDDSQYHTVAIDRQQKVLYRVYIFDNGPDEPSDGAFRIQKNGKIGYADAITGKVVISAQYACAWPFENGGAKVAFDCRRQGDSEHYTWVSDHWFYINKKGERMAGR